MKKMMKVATFVAMVLAAGFISCQEKIPGYLIVDGTTLTGYTDGVPANLVIPKGITKIGEEAFIRCESLTSVTIPKSVTKISARAFFGCDSLTSVIIPNSVTEIGKSAFSECGSLTSVIIPNSVREIGKEAFFKCSSLMSVTIPNSVKTIGYEAFGNCENIAVVTYKGSLKDWCAVDWDTYLLYFAKRIALSDGTDPRKLTEITANDLAGVTKIGKYAFARFKSLASVTIPNSVAEIGEGAFYGCKSLESVTIPGSVTTISYDAFFSCKSLTSVQYGGTKAEWGRIAIESASGLSGKTITGKDGLTWTAE